MSPTLTEVGQDLGRNVTLNSSEPTVGDGDALVADPGRNGNQWRTP